MTQCFSSAGPRSWCFEDADGMPIGFVTVDRIVAGRSCGGIRASANVTAHEIERIARVMTLKCGFAGLATGGAKGGVVVPEHFSPEQRVARLRAFGLAASQLLQSGIWSHGTDMGTTSLDIFRIRHAAGIGPDPDMPVSPTGRSNDNALSGLAAGLTVALSTEAALAALGIPLHGARVAIQGVGAVGRAAMDSLAGSGARIVAVSTISGTWRDDRGINLDALRHDLSTAKDPFIGSALRPEALLDVPCDAMLLCAGTDALDTTAAERLQARTVICGANIPFTGAVANQLEERGILVVPDFVAGGGGVLGSTLGSACGATTSDVGAILRRCFKPLVEQILAAASASGTAVSVAAERHALRVLEACDRAYGPTRPATLLAERLARPASPALRLILATERRSRGSRRLAPLARMLHATAIAHAERVLHASHAHGGRP